MPPRLGISGMWKAVSTRRESDPEFVVWRIKAENDDGGEQSVLVKIDAATVANTPWTANKGVLPHVREAMESRGTSLIESMRHRDVLPQSIVHRAGAKGSSRTNSTPLFRMDSARSVAGFTDSCSFWLD